MSGLKVIVRSKCDIAGRGSVNEETYKCKELSL